MATRALVAVPFLGLSALMVRAFIQFSAPITPLIEDIRSTSVFSLNGVTVPLRSSFYGIPGLDEALASIVVAFAPLQFWPADEKAWWQCTLFVMEAGFAYGIMLLEACRQSNQKSIFRFPMLVTFLGQFVCLGILAPMWFYFFWVFTPTTKLSVSNSVINPSGAVAVLPAVMLVYFGPLFLAWFHPVYETQHYWSWIWQVYPIWGAIAQFILSSILPAPKSAKSVVRFTVVIFALMGVASHWYLLSQAKESWAEIFVPPFWADDGLDGWAGLRAVLQWDYVCSVGPALIWLLYSFADLKAAGICKTSWVVLLGGAAVIGPVLGAGTLMAVAWGIREEILMGRSKGVAQKKR